jgi:hypothetical protein
MNAGWRKRALEKSRQEVTRQVGYNNKKVTSSANKHWSSQYLRPLRAFATTTSSSVFCLVSCVTKSKGFSQVKGMHGIKFVDVVGEL